MGLRRPVASFEPTSRTSETIIMLPSGDAGVCSVAPGHTDVGSIPIARSITPDDPIALTRPSDPISPLKTAVLVLRWCVDPRHKGARTSFFCGNAVPINVRRENSL